MLVYISITKEKIMTEVKTTLEDALWCAEMIKGKELYYTYYGESAETLYRGGKVLAVEEIAENLIRANA